jgi:hypothetical protein
MGATSGRLGEAEHRRLAASVRAEMNAWFAEMSARATTGVLTAEEIRRFVASLPPPGARPAPSK